MLDARILLILVPIVLFWLLMGFNHRRPGPERRLRVKRLIAYLAGSNNEWVSLSALATQLGFLSMLGWYILFATSDIEYLQNNAFALSVVVGGISILVFRRLLAFL